MKNMLLRPPLRYLTALILPGKKTNKTAPAPAPAAGEKVLLGADVGRNLPAGAVEEDVGAIAGDDATPPDFECSICVESKCKGEIFEVPGCLHRYCAECVDRHITAKVEENIVAVGCPFPGCGSGALEPEACKTILPPEVFFRWGKALCEAAIPETQKLYCPFRDCSALLIADGERRPKDAECPHCRRRFCASCRVPWHEGVDCEQYQKLEVGERGKEDLLLFKQARERKWKRCPRCRAYVERSEGCVFINCRCGECFCCRCGLSLADPGHRIAKCQHLNMADLAAAAGRLISRFSKCFFFCRSRRRIRENVPRTRALRPC